MFTNFMCLGRRIEDDSYTHWKEVDGGEEFIGHKSLICFPGSFARQPNHANGFCKAVEGIVSTQAREKIQNNLYSVYYHEAKVAGNNDDFFRKYFLPLIAGPESALKSEKDLSAIDALSYEEVSNNLRNITLVTHCYGSLQVAELEAFLRRNLKQLGFSDADRKEMLKQIFVIHFNDIHHDFGKTKMTALHVVSQNDITSMELSSLENDSLKYHCYNDKVGDDKIATFKISDNEVVIVCDHFLDKYKSHEDDHDGALWTESRMNAVAHGAYQAYTSVLDYVLRSNEAVVGIDTLILKSAELRKKDAFKDMQTLQSDRSTGVPIALLQQQSKESADISKAITRAAREAEPTNLRKDNVFLTKALMKKHNTR